MQTEKGRANRHALGSIRRNDVNWNYFVAAFAALVAVVVASLTAAVASS